MDQFQHKLEGTNIVKFNDFIDNVKLIAGTALSLTVKQFNSHEDRICSYAHVNHRFHLRWNEVLEKADLKAKKIFKIIKQGRKSIDKSNYKWVQCLRCLKKFRSWDKRFNRICNKCNIK